ncbi:MAG TPA: PQQ-dependent sugar dehydrogenase, partial [Candidatus Limnocylindrales bacterium]|nr:PQQ-dependent sugar dehydrogenase [Candidatus Limnocylindrales bacterium]
DLHVVLVKSGFSSPVLVTNAHDGSHRLFVVEQAGDIRILAGSTILATPFLDLRGSITSGGERGLLGLAFDPKFPTYPYIYVDFTDRDGNTAISRYTVSKTNANVIDRASGVRILTIGQPYDNHNGGNLAFGHDGFLYVGMGDGGSAGDPGNRAQSLSSLLGKILRIDVHHGTRTTHYVVPSTNPYVGKTGNDLIWASGLRNPWRWSFDSATGGLWIGDVGQDRWEEIDRSLPSGTTPAGRGANYGWRQLEGFACYQPSSGCSTSGKTKPLLAYAHVVSGADNCAVTGGFVYRGGGSPVLAGGYVFGDFCSGRIWAVSATAASPAAPTLLRSDTASPHLSISSFGLDDTGELYVVDLGGAIYRLSATAKP